MALPETLNCDKGNMVLEKVPNVVCEKLAELVMGELKVPNVL